MFKRGFTNPVRHLHDRVSVECITHVTRPLSSVPPLFRILGENNTANVTLYSQYRRELLKVCSGAGELGNASTQLSDVLSIRRKQDQVWSPENVHVLIKRRSQVNPMRFEDIAQELNTLEERNCTVQSSRPYSKTDCQNKWATLFPSSADMFSTIKYLLKLRTEWPGTVVKVEHDFDKQYPTIRAIHIVWSWARQTMKCLSKTVFCDATYHVTVYVYKVVMLTTLDGNHQHRPLMASFITESTTIQWQIIFNIFYKSGLHHDQVFL